MSKLLLLSNSKNHEQAYLEHAVSWIQDHFAGAKKILFVPYAEVQGPEAVDAYAKKAADFFKTIGIEVISAHESQYPVDLLEQVQGIFVGGGSTPYLLKTLQENGLLDAIADKVRQGMPYLGSSAGSVICCPTIMTTNDMFIVRGLANLDGMGLFPAQINVHHPREGEPWAPNIGESRDDRIWDYHALESTPVVGLREGSALLVEDGKVTLLGPHKARYFEQKKSPAELTSEELNLAMSSLLARSIDATPAVFAASVSTAPYAAFMSPEARPYTAVPDEPACSSSLTNSQG